MQGVRFVLYNIYQKDLSENQENRISKKHQVSFTVDAGIINRLGKELVGRAETAVSELVKNAYDADARSVKLLFIDTENEGGELHIVDDGNGMTYKQLIDGFMRLSSSDKIHNPVSPIYKRLRAGKKGIGRFATQRLGKELTIITKGRNSETAFRLDINWKQYSIDEDLSSINNTVEEVSVNFEQGTQLIINDLRDSWTEAQIRRVFRYVSDLLQPNYISERSSELNIAINEKDESFLVECYQVIDDEFYRIADLDQMVFDNALGVIEGSIENDKASCKVVSDRFGVNDEINIKGEFYHIKYVHFKVYYFIYKYEWYEGFIPKMEYNKITNFSDENGGIRLYRNGFRVLPYGEKGNDWLNLDKTSVKTSSKAYVPFNNNNFFGFVEVIDPEGELFEETSSREGLIENEPFNQLTNFVNKSLRVSAQRINSARLTEKKNKSRIKPSNSSAINNKSAREKLNELKGESEETDELIDEIIFELEEIEMLRVLAGIGLNIAEFTHEIRQFIPSFNGSIDFLLNSSLSEEVNETLINLQKNFNRFKSYTNYIDHTLSQNANREKKPIKLRKVLDDFADILSNDMIDEKIEYDIEYYGYDLYTTPMHPSEWTSILYNLYTNSKKATKRANVSTPKIRVVCGRDKSNVYLEFMDNGDGIPSDIEHRIFDPFFTTSTPSSFDATKNDLLIGTGLGLKIIRDIVESYQGTVELVEPDSGFVTNFRIEIPEANETQLDVYGL